VNYYLKGFLSFKGRMARIPYFCFSFTVFMAIFVLSYLWGLYVVSGPWLILETLAVALICLLASWANLAITTKRLHDLGLSGWHMLWMFIPTVLPFFTPNTYLVLGSWLTSALISLWLIFMPPSKSTRYA
jgi:uncharacterized membrane protein YhaH (DUF805 family)